MQINKSHSTVATTLLSLMFVLVAWLTLAPTQLGGQVSYVIVDGNSMEKGFHLGDLVLVRKTLAYQIGDAVTYQNAELGRAVFHRIAKLNLDHFVLKGDNNSWFDSYQPTREEIIGKLWIHIPKLGKAIEWLRLPINLAIAIVLLGGSLMSNMLIKSPKRRKSDTRSLPKFGSALEVALYPLGFLVLIFLGLGIFAFTRPLTRAADNILYQQDGDFFYSATGTPQIYDTDTIHSGEPVFPKLTCFLNVGFAYNLTGGQMQEVSGKQQLSARVMDEQSGWQRTIPMVSETVLNGSSYMTMATLDICQVEALVSLLEQETGLHQNTYTLKIIPHADVVATISGNKVQESFEPSLSFKFDEVHFYLASDNAQGNDPLHITKQGSVSSSNTQANILLLFGWKLSIQAMRAGALIGLGLALGPFLSIGLHIYNKAQKSQQALIQLKYGALLMDVHEHVVEPLSPAIDVRRIDDLARIAERQNTMILHMVFNYMDYYLVQGNGMTYRYVVGNISQRDNIAMEEPAYRDIRDYMLSNNAKGFVDADPAREVIVMDSGFTDGNETQIVQPAEKVVMRYSINISRSHTKS
jgi:signal peptidase I